MSPSSGDVHTALLNPHQLTLKQTTHLCFQRHNYNIVCRSNPKKTNRNS